MIFRELSSKDVCKDYLDTLNDYDYMKYMVFRGKHWTESNLTEYIVNAKHDKVLLLYGLFDNGKLVGTTRIKIFDNNKSEMGLMVFKKYQGKGYGKIIIKNIIKLYPNNEIYAGIFVDNIASMICFLKSGFKIVDYERWHFQYEDRVLLRYKGDKE